MERGERGGEEVLEERDMSLEEYLALFEEGSADYSLLKQRSDRLARIVVKRVRDAAGRRFEDTTFIEKTGITYTVRAKLEP